MNVSEWLCSVREELSKVGSETMSRTAWMAVVEGARHSLRSRSAKRLLAMVPTNGLPVTWLLPVSPTAADTSLSAVELSVAASLRFGQLRDRAEGKKRKILGSTPSHEDAAIASKGIYCISRQRTPTERLQVL